MSYMSYSTYFLKAGDTVSCMRCRKEMILKHDPPKCCMNKQDALHNQCGCQGVPEPILCDECWDTINP